MLVFDIEKQQLHFMYYLLDLTLLDEKMCKYQPSLIAISVIYLSNKLLNCKNILPSSLFELIRHDSTSIRSCALKISELKDQIEKVQ
jgi:hypothetical protein